MEGLNQIIQVILRQPLDNAGKAQGLILHESHKNTVAPLEIHDPHDQDQTDENGTDNGDGNRLEEKLIFLPGTVPPDHFFIRSHKNLKKAIESSSA